MKFHKTILTLLAVMLAVIGTTAVAHADGPEQKEVSINDLLRQINEAEDPQSDWASLSDQEQTALLNLEVDRIETSHTYGIIPFNGNQMAKGAGVSGGATAKSTSC